MNYPNSQIVAPINGCARNVIRFDLELFNGYSDVDFLNAICYKLNECIDAVNLTQEQFSKIVEFVNNMLKQYTQEQLQQWLEDGTIMEMIAKFMNFIVTPQMFGAKADGTTDDTISFQKALNNGSPVFIPNGNYKITTSLNIPSKSFITGCGKKAIINYTGTGFCFITEDHSIGVTIKDLRIICNDNGSGIQLYNSSNSGLEEYDVQHRLINLSISHGITGIEISNYCRECTVDNCYIDVMTTGIRVNGTDNKIINSTCGNILQNGFYIWNNNNLVSNCKAFLCGKNGNNYAGFYIEGNFSSLVSLICQQNYTNGVILNAGRCQLTNVISEWNNYSKSTDLTADIQILNNYNYVNANIITGNNYTYTKYAIYFGDKTHDNNVNSTVTRADNNTTIVTGYDTAFFNETDVIKIINSICLNGILYKPQTLPIDFRVDLERYDYTGGYTKVLETYTITNNFPVSATPKYGSTIRMNITSADLSSLAYVAIVAEQGGKTNTQNRASYANIDCYNKNDTSYTPLSPYVALNTTTLSEYVHLYNIIDVSKVTNDLSIWVGNLVNNTQNVTTYAESKFRYLKVYLIPKGV